MKADDDNSQETKSHGIPDNNGEGHERRHKHADGNEHDDNGRHHDKADVHGHDHEHAQSSVITISLVISGALVGLALLLHWRGIVAGAQWTAIAAMIAGGWFLLPSAWAAVRRLRPDINLLVVIAAIGASIVGEWVEAGTVVFLFGVAEWL